MSGYWPEAGDWVEVVLRGEVKRVGRNSFDLNGNGIFPAYQHVVSVEKVEPPKPPLPTTPGSVIQADGCFLVLSTSGQWGCPDHPMSGGALLLHDRAEVLFDAGAES